jgi:flagellar biosynthesis/type III secretory pathway protein FliH
MSSPNVRFNPDTPSSLPAAWPLEELHALDGEMFHADGGESVPANAAELAAIAHAERERLVAEAYAAGQEAGRAAAHAAAQEMMSSALATLRAAGEQLTASEARFLGALEENLATLAVSIARQIIAREVRTSHEVIIDLVRHAVTEFPIDNPLRIRINPLDLSALAATPDGDVVRIAPGREITWVADARIYPGGCMVEGRERIIDGRVDTALERVYHRLINTQES